MSISVFLKDIQTFKADHEKLTMSGGKREGVGASA